MRRSSLKIPKERYENDGKKREGNSNLSISKENTILILQNITTSSMISIGKTDKVEIGLE